MRKKMADKHSVMNLKILNAILSSLVVAGVTFYAMFGMRMATKEDIQIIYNQIEKFDEKVDYKIKTQTPYVEDKKMVNTRIDMALNGNIKNENAIISLQKSIQELTVGQAEIKAEINTRLDILISQIEGLRRR
jgi:predicted metal-dependent TIM-barrel fold hydrolase